MGADQVIDDLLTQRTGLGLVDSGPVTQGLGPTWTIAPEPVMQDGAGLRAAFLLRAEKRRLPLTPMRGPAKPRWEPGMPVA